ncbi:MAG: DNA methyltransferase [Chloroflexota bacterium]|nr:DNA methyltransferase [Chloroflexota bacterium]
MSKALLGEGGSIFVQISDENVHRVRAVLDEVFGAHNFVSQVNIKKASVMFSKKLLNNASYYLLWYAKDKDKTKYNQLFIAKDEQWFADNVGSHLWIENPENGESRKVTPEERGNIKELLQNLPNCKLYGTWSLNAQGTEKQKDYTYKGIPYFPPKGTQWKTSYPEGLDRLRDINRLQVEGNNLRFKIYFEDYPVMPQNNLWDKIGAASNKVFVVQTPEEIVKRCVLMTSQPGELVIDITCGGGTSAYVCEEWGRRWITCDTSRVSITVAKQRLMAAGFDYYELAHPEEGVSSGFKYMTVPHVTVRSIANNPEIKAGMKRDQIEAAIRKYADQETLYDQPVPDRNRARVSGPFTVEAVPAPVVRPLHEIPEHGGPGTVQAADQAVARSGETARQRDWRDELLKTGIRGKGGQRIQFSRVEPLPGTRWLHADAETKVEKPERVVVSFGPEHGPLDQRQVPLALEEAQTLVPRPRLVIFAAFEFDPEAAKDIDETNWPGVTLLKAKMNADLLTDDLKKKRASNDSFWLVGQPDVELRHLTSGQDKDKWQVEVRGFDYFNTRTGELVSGGTANIAMWLLDTDYDGRSLYPRQVFFPLADDKGGWARLARTLKAEIDEDAIEQYRGTVSLPFEMGSQKRVAVKIVDDRGIESLKVIRAE